MPETRTFKTQDGARIGYRVHGDDPRKTPLVLVNGLSAVMEDWSPLVEALSKTRRVLIFDHRGIGASYTPEDWDYELSLEIMGLDAIELVKSLGWNRIDILGFSMGGHIVQALLTIDEALTVDGLREIRGVKIGKAVLSATMAKLPHGDIDTQALQEEGNKIEDKQKRKLFLTEELMKLQYHPEALVHGSEICRKFQRRIEVSLKTRRPAEIIGFQFLAIQANDVREKLHRIPSSLPVLIIHGRRDRMVSFSETEYTTKGIPHALWFKAKGGDQFGHFWYDYFELQDWVNGIAAFLDQDQGAKAHL
ncbi:alpha/beta-hydrolase [Violaceomyces palustris]|uniref:Alpha/beta-hydrolase n=1 Tax=Violaceomyces palustris TaxID=1673888 RepID=A0ACD0NZB5_9BASI|nr:alpha/beta-hydrolase [Violaceomyces palustris]